MSSSPAESPAAPAERKSARTIWIVAGVLGVIAFFYLVPELFVAYTEDAYVRSDFVEVAPEVSGVIAQVDVVDNQTVSVGTPLAAIDPKPFQLEVDLKQKQVENALAAAKVKQDGAQVIAADIDSAKAAVTLAQREYDRFHALVSEQAVSQEVLDRATDQRQTTLDTLAQKQSDAKVNAGEVAAAEAQVEITKAELALAQYNLSRTRLAAPVPGYVTNLILRPGAYASAGKPVVGIVDETQWRITANFKEYVASRLKPGMRAWVWLDSSPWRLMPARVVGVARGISRDQETGRMLPYVAPTTDWIRLLRRLPVTLVLDPKPADVPLFMGADARVLLFP
ncbi:HlyD family secretion protein [Aquabacter sp. CN5-332]|uniref:HlyD family secretion protein n=1 Tax=Aquabacter sp. CN5-332 TaxID=3156608 RepID=UPI0032B3A3A2